MNDNHNLKNGAKPNDEAKPRKIPIIETLKPKKRHTKLEKDMIKAMEDVMDAIIKQQNAKV